ncbi:hypothetical protein Ddye_003073 [Dipteronia dyeriana]|uniref:H15 domain-containing protein n=1 Tax=Dipteronia dyeriana TaxID=168575 RepID=A0AAD9XRL5_9ROSI|nr:hypothetical protein Ddye_003073 [Dipteronia dyeriana]
MDPFPVPVALENQPPQSHPPPQQQPPVVFFPHHPSAAAAAAAAIPPAAPAAPPVLNHPPPYAEMIYAAISALKEKDGSSKIAIGKHIEQTYSNLPANHSTLLTQHLQRLRNTGHLLMVKKSYKLPRSDDAPVPETNNSNQDNAVNLSFSAHGPKTSRGRGRPPKNLNAVKAQPVSVPVGLFDQPPHLTPAKRGRGRPKKIGGPPMGLGGVPKVPIGSGRRPGRPKKLKPVRSTNGVALVHAQAQPISYAIGEANAAVPVQVPVQNVGRPRGRGRPKKLAAAAMVKPVGRPMGRPVGRPKKSKSRTGRPVGRPRKIETEAAEAQAGTTNGDLRRKLEYFQTKVKQVVDVLKPQLTGESQISAVAAIQELEGLATMDITAPLREDAPQPPPQVQN